jgi:hypothetical protein
MAQYIPGIVPASLVGGGPSSSNSILLESAEIAETNKGYFQEYLRLELEKIAATFAEQDFVQLKKTYVEPTRPRDGMVVYADGTSWNPGAGEGYYGYYAASWHKLG